MPFQPGQSGNPAGRPRQSHSPTSAAELRVKSTLDQRPRKVIVGTTMQAFWVEYPGLEKRLEQLSGLIDRLAEESGKKFGRGLDLAILPEMAVTGELSGDVVGHSLPFEGPMRDTFVRKAREHHCYIVVPTYLLDDKEKKVCSNAAILIAAGSTSPKSSVTTVRRSVGGLSASGEASGANAQSILCNQPRWCMKPIFGSRVTRRSTGKIPSISSEFSRA